MREGAVIVLGAGPAGVAAGLALGDDGLVLEPRADVGGLSRTIELDGAVFDIGGHSFHTPHPDIRALVFGALDMYEQPREARCFSHGVTIPYPFQEHFRQLPDPAVVGECLAGIPTAGGSDGTRNFEDHIHLRFGPGVCHHFLFPYNRKLWKTDLRELSTDWAGERVAGAGRPEAAGNGKRQPLRSDSTVAYPARGGFGEIVRCLARRLPHLRLGQRAVRLDPSRRELVLEGGDVLRWRRLVSTLALPQLLAITAGVPPAMSAMVRRLRSLPLVLVLVVMGHPVDTPIQRIYCADPEFLAHKIVVNHNSSPFLRCLPHHGVLAEVSCRWGMPAPAAEIEKQVVIELMRIGVVQALSDVRTTHLIHVPDGYPVPTHDRDSIVREVKGWLEEQSIYTVGRFGEWAYINSDEALARGLALGRRLAA
jgi:protoporphyrinogen oxidase